MNSSPDKACLSAIKYLKEKK